MAKLSILIVDDEQRVRDEIGEFLTESKYMVFKAGLPSEAYGILENNDIDIVILDIRLPEENGIDVLAKIKKSFPGTEVIMISGHGDMNSVIEAMRSGAADFFPKPFRMMDVQYSIQRTTKFIRLTEKLRELENNYSLLAREFQKEHGHQIIGNSNAIRNIIGLMSKVAHVENTTVLIAGESGTGKELVARGIHYLSSRKDNFFHTVNCSAIPETLFESEFFGHRKGSFTGAIENKAGWFEIANKGTLFLDEIGDMPLLQQAKLLRVLEEKSVSRIGSREKINVDVRVIAASNQELLKMGHEKKFRLDLYHRLSSFVISIPPLREHREDIPALFSYFVRLYSERLGKNIQKYDKAIIAQLNKYDFPGNIRELRNMVERAIIINETGHLGLADFNFDPSEVVRDTVDADVPAFDIFDLEASEKILIRKALEKSNFNKSKAAELLKISWQSLDRRIKKFGL
ncbi:MAG: sigma-54-dependent Fis family transcriptional regulator [Bacteroidales bacterium]|nr:sigma-54-dependent Fis family transcriptional regulator [Bacteroidales bacterium]